MKDKTVSFLSQVKCHSFWFQKHYCAPKVGTCWCFWNSVLQALRAPQCLRSQKATAAQLLNRQIAEKPRKQGSVSYTSELMGNLVNIGQKPPFFPEKSTCHYCESTEAFNSYRSVIRDRKHMVPGNFQTVKKIAAVLGH